MKTIVATVIAVGLCASVAPAGAAVPNKTSAFEGWQGIHIMYGRRGVDTCDLSFPDTFGYKNRSQLQDLLAIARNGAEVENDVGCLAPPAYYALEQLLRLAVDKQDQTAAHLILRPSLYGGLELDGELAEQYTLDMKLPVLMKFKGMTKLLVADPELGVESIDEIVDDLCSEWGYDPKLIQAMPSGLKRNGLEDLAMRFKQKCDSAVAKNPDIRRMPRER